MFIRYTKAQRIDKSACMFVAGCDGRTADACHRPCYLVGYFSDYC